MNHLPPFTAPASLAVQSRRGQLRDAAGTWMNTSGMKSSNETGHRGRGLTVWLCTTAMAIAQDTAHLPLVSVLQVINVEPDSWICAKASLMGRLNSLLG
jgi:hypothetical protein